MLSLVVVQSFLIFACICRFRKTWCSSVTLGAKASMDRVANLILYAIQRSPEHRV